MTTQPSLDLPKLRAVDIRPHHQNGQAYYLLRDPLQLTEHVLLVPQPLAAVLAFCDGHHSPRQIATAFQRHFGLALGIDQIQELVTELDKACLLENERAQQAREAALATFRAAPARPALLAGQSYPATATGLRNLFDGYLNGVTQTPAPAPGQLAGLLSPHIDYARGGPVYAQVWQRASAAAQAAELVIVFGTDHYGDDTFTLTRQHYATPYGVLPTDQPLVDELAALIGPEAAFQGELRHRSEHSLELVLLWLHHMRGGKPCPVIPILCGSFSNYMHNGASPHTDETAHLLLEHLRQGMGGRRVLVVASGDLAHVGPAFGGAPLDAPTRTEVKSADDEMIRQMVAGNADGFFNVVRRSQNRYNVCGVSPIYLTMRLLGNVRGELNGYASCRADTENSSAVTVGGVYFHVS